MFLSTLEATIYFILLVLTFYETNCQNMRIIRGEKDIITHLNGCEPTQAICFADQNGTYCQCKRNKTFIPTKGKCGECVPNEYLAYMTCKRDVSAVGCESYQDNSSLLILNETSKCKKSRCWGEKEINVGTKNFKGCSLLPNQAVQYLHKDGWKPLSMAPNSLVLVTNKSKVLLKSSILYVKWNLTKTPKSWKGLIVKVQYQCKSEDDHDNEDVHCVLIKYKGLFTGFNISGGNKKRDKIDNKSDTTAVAVSVVVVAVIIGLLILFAYKYKTRLATLNRRKTKKEDVTNASPEQTRGISNNPIYHLGDKNSAQKNCELYEETPKSEPVYQYAYAGRNMKAQLPANVTYDYATPDDHLRDCQRAAVGKPRNSTGENIVSQNASGPKAPVYFVLENNN